MHARVPMALLVSLLCNCARGWLCKGMTTCVRQTREAHVGDGAIALAGERVFVVQSTLVWHLRGSTSGDRHYPIMQYIIS